jgi:hypothetical protein
MTKPILMGYLQPLHGIRKTGADYRLHRTFINFGDTAYTYPGALLAAGRNFEAWDYVMSAEEVNERYSHVVFIVPCRITPPPYDETGFPFDLVADFVERLKIPFTTVTESIQSPDYDYDPDLHRKLRGPVLRYIRVLASRSRIVGVRGSYSAEVLNALGIRNVEVVGCPSLYIHGPSLPESLRQHRPYEDLRRIGVCYSNHQMNPGSRIRDVLEVAAAQGHHYVEQSFNLVVKALFYPGRITAQDLLEARREFLDLKAVRTLYRENRLRYFTNYKLWREHFATMDFVYGARMHGLTLALRSGVKAAFVAHDARIREMVEFFRLPCTAERDLPRPFDARELYERCDYGPALAAYPAHYRAFLDFLTRNGIQPNVDAEGRIADFWEPEPYPEVRLGETRDRGRLDASFFDLLCGYAEVLEACPGLEPAVRNLAQAWYEARVTLGEPF